MPIAVLSQAWHRSRGAYRGGRPREEPMGRRGAPDSDRSGAMLGQDAHLTGREIIVAASDRELTAADSGGQIRFSGSQLIDTHCDICPNRVVQLIARLIEHT